MLVTSEQDIHKAELARRFGWHMPQVDRLFDLRHASKLDQIEAAAQFEVGSWKCGLRDALSKLVRTNVFKKNQTD